MSSGDSIILEGTRANLIASGTARDSADIADVRHLYVVSFVSMGPTEDEKFFVVVLPDRVWVIPDNVERLQVFLDAIVPLLSAEGRVSRLVTTSLPLSWRMRVWGLPLFPVPRLAQQPLGSLPLTKWVERPMDQAEIKELTQVNVRAIPNFAWLTIRRPVKA